MIGGRQTRSVFRRLSDDMAGDAEAARADTNIGRIRWAKP